MYASNASNIGIINNDAPRFVLRFLLLSFGMLAIWYVLLLGNMVFNIVERRQLEAEVRVLSSEVADLELAYLSVLSNINLELSHSIGFKEVKAKFATRKSLGSINTLQNEI